MTIKLKGGSLSETFLIEEDGKKIVRKSVSLVRNREYGFQRWYSQMKRLQRYSVIVPGLFPNVLKYGVGRDFAYFDMNFIEDSVNAQEYLAAERDADKIGVFFEELKVSMRLLHDIKLQSCSEAMELYVREEVSQKINDSISSEKFKEFLQYKTIVFNGEEIISFIYRMDDFKQMLAKHYVDVEETYSHGNLTLENLLFVPSQNKIVFIDPYEENIIDSRLADYSQLLQSSNSKYEILNKLTPFVSKNRVEMFIDGNFGVDYFNDLLEEYLVETLSQSQYIVVKLLEISQFIRMLPFKKEIDEDKMILFYSLASKLFARFYG
jgi:hypothetical protein